MRTEVIQHSGVGRRARLARTVWFVGGSYATGTPVEILEGFMGGFTFLVRFPDGVERLVLQESVEVEG